MHLRNLESLRRVLGILRSSKLENLTLRALYSHTLKDAIIDFETDVNELNKVQRFRKLDGEPATVGKLQVNPIVRVLRNVSSVMHLMRSYEAAVSERSSLHLAQFFTCLAQFLALVKVKAAMGKLENLKSLLGQAKGFLSRSY